MNNGWLIEDILNMRTRFSDIICQISLSYHIVGTNTFLHFVVLFLF